MKKWLARLAGVCGLAVCAAGCFATTTYADTLKSAHYQFVQSVLGNGGLPLSNSQNYQFSESIGDLAVGHSASGNYQVNAGTITTGDPALGFAINNGTASFGNFSPSTTAVATVTFSASNYTSYGYVVQILGNPPSNGSHTIKAMTTTGASQTGTEQFGVNLVANTSPTSLGANPNYGQFGTSTAGPTANYDTSNKYRYVNGETIATSPKSSGVITYTISYIINVGSLTPGGQYTSQQSIVCTGTF